MEITAFREREFIPLSITIKFESNAELSNFMKLVVDFGSQGFVNQITDALRVVDI